MEKDLQRHIRSAGRLIYAERDAYLVHDGLTFADATSTSVRASSKSLMPMCLQAAISACKQIYHQHLLRLLLRHDLFHSLPRGRDFRRRETWRVNETEVDILDAELQTRVSCVGTNMTKGDVRFQGCS